MTAVVYAHKAGRGNGVGLHYSRFRPSWRFIIPSNQRLGLMPPAQNRHFPPRIREVGLTTATPLPNRSFGPKGPTPSFENTNGLSGTLFRGRDTRGRLGWQLTVRFSVTNVRRQALSGGKCVKTPGRDGRASGGEAVVHGPDGGLGTVVDVDLAQQRL